MARRAGRAARCAARLSQGPAVSCGVAGAPWLCPPAPPVARSRLSESSRNTPAATIRSPSSRPLADLDAIRQLHAERHRARLESIAGGDEDVLLHAGVDHGVTRHGDHLLPGRFEGRRAVEARPEPAAGIGRREADPQRARAVGERRIEEIDACRERRTARRREIELRGRADANAPECSPPAPRRAPRRATGPQSSAASSTDRPTCPP